MIFIKVSEAKKGNQSIFPNKVVSSNVQIAITPSSADE